MIVSKLLTTDQKPLEKKPPYIKPKHKTYRQLLNLDKPKVKIVVESDHEGDDFLEKLLKEEKQQKKKRKKLKVKSIKSKKESDKDPIQSKQVTQIQPVEETYEDIILKEKTKDEKTSTQFTNQKIFSRTMKRIKANVARKVTSAKNQIMIDETDEVGYKIINGWTASKTKSMKCLNILQHQCKPQQIELKSSLTQNKILHNVQDKQRVHKSAKSDWFQRFLSHQPEFTKPRPKTKMVNRQTLFRNNFQETMFLQHLKTYRKRTSC